MPRHNHVPSPRPGNGNGGVGTPMSMLDSAPWYVKLVVYLLVWFGFPVAMSVFLLMALIGYIPSPLTKLDKEMTTHVEDLRAVIRLVESNARVQRQICRNTSTNAAERVECDR